ncbi:hypothetical protein [Novacetimonas pomaceti]
MFLRRPAQRRWIVVGDPLVMHHALAGLDPAAHVRRITTLAEACFDDDVLHVLASSECECLLPVGRITVESGRAAYAAILAAIQLAKNEVVSPIRKPPRSGMNASVPPAYRPATGG